MNIFIDARLLTSGHTSGIEEYTRLLINALVRHNDPSHTYTLFYNGFKKPPAPKEWAKNERVHVIETNIPNRILDASIRFFGWPTVHNFADADIVLSPHFNLLKVPRGMGHVLTIHDLSFIHYRDSFSLRKRLWHWQQNYLRSVRRAHRIVTLAHFTKYDIANTFHIPEEKISVIYPGVNPFYTARDVRSDEHKGFLRVHGLQGPFILFVGTLEPRKNIPLLIRAFSTMKERSVHHDLKLVIAGRKGWLCDTIFKEAARSSYASQIMFWGPASYEDLAHLYTAARACVYPSFFEGFGFPPLEAQQCGTPVIVSNRTTLPEVMGNSGLLVNPTSVDELVMGLESLLGSETLRKEYIERGFKNAARFSWEKTAQATLKIFESLLQKK